MNNRHILETHCPSSHSSSHYEAVAVGSSQETGVGGGETPLLCETPLFSLPLCGDLGRGPWSG
jgi:hypothetical protein